jgi:pyrophosphatase PpaX
LIKPSKPLVAAPLNWGRPDGLAVMLKAVIFDLDDTLLNSMPARKAALSRVFQKMKLNIDPGWFFASIKGGSFHGALAQLAEKHNIGEDLFALYRRIYWFETRPKVALYPGVPQMLKVLKGRGLSLAIVTNKFRDIEFEGGRIGCALEIKETGIDRYFSAVIGLEDVKEQKPDPEGIQLALANLGIQPGESLVVGDSPADMAAAKTAGCKSCLALWGILGEKITDEDFSAREPVGIINIVNKCS